MKPGSWGCFSVALLIALALSAGAANARALDRLQARVAELLAGDSPQASLPQARGTPVGLPHTLERGSHWYRIEFEAPAATAETWAVYLPYFYGGGELLLNGAPLARVAGSGEGYLVRWERPFLVPVPDTMLRAGPNVLLVRPGEEPVSRRVRMPAPSVGPQSLLAGQYETRRFWVRTMPQFTVIACLVVGLLVSFIWWRRREEMLYGLFGLATLLWGARTLTFLIEALPAPWWPAWRMLYHSATGGFIVVLMVFSLRLAGIRRPGVEWSLFAFWLLGPLGYLVTGGSETLVGRVWSGGLIPIGVGILVTCAVAAWRQRTLTMIALSVAILLAVVAGVNDYLLAANSTWLTALAPQWTAQRLFMLHYAADLLLLVMGAILSARFVAALQDLALLNQTLEARVADRERALAENYTQLGRLERQHAADEERQRIMRDLHDGLGSQLFVTLTRVESGQIEHARIAQALRDCIADMRLTLEAMGPDGNDFLEAWSNFRFRWERQLETAGVRSTWTVVTRNDVLDIAPHAGLQLLRIAQEALTNVLKHAAAQHVEISLREKEGRVLLVVHDDGVGLAQAGRPGRGLANMRTRAARLGGEIHLDAAGAGTRVRFGFAPAAVSQPGALARAP